eukprot:7120614-Pyramimonas_sp.AAC.1
MLSCTAYSSSCGRLCSRLMPSSMAACSLLPVAAAIWRSERLWAVSPRSSDGGSTQAGCARASDGSAGRMPSAGLR